VSAAVLPSLVAAAVIGSGCSVATEYVPQTPGVAAIGVQGNELGVYKNGTFTRMTDVAPVLLNCSTAAATTARRAEVYRDDAVRTRWIGLPFSSLGWILPPLYVIGVIFGAASDDAMGTSSALAVDAVNLHNDTAECFPPAAPVDGAQP